jgi:hypothetical protein
MSFPHLRRIADLALPRSELLPALFKAIATPWSKSL